MKMNRKIGAVLALVSVVLVTSLGLLRSQSGPLGVVISEDEALDIAAIAALAVSSAQFSDADVGDGLSRRDVHAKAHACLKATFHVESDLAPSLQYGVFKQAKVYSAWVRFSNGSTVPKPDTARDARGMAIKLMNLEQETLMTRPEDHGSQDFLMINHDVFFVPTVKEYRVFMEGQAQGDALSYFFNNGDWNPFNWRFRQMRLALAIQKPAPASLLTESFFSVSAYRLGPTQFMKFAAKPCESNQAVAVGEASNRLQRELRANLATNDACFDFMVQRQNTEAYMPVEDTTVRWQTRDAAFVKVARLLIPKQSFDTQEQHQFCEALSFTPWHAVPDLEPVGAMNRVRKASYEAVSQYRHQRNGSVKFEPTGVCLRLDGQACTSPSPSPSPP